MNKATAILAAILAVILIAGAFTGGYFAGRGRKPQVQRDTVIKVETYRDTVTVYEPKEVTKTIIRKEYIAVTDTFVRNDTTYIEMPVERKEYRDSNYYAVVSGIRPQLDEISVYPETKVITKEITVYEERKPTRFGVGLQVGFGAQYGIRGKQFDVGPYLGVGISYNFIRF